MKSTFVKAALAAVCFVTGSAAIAETSGVLFGSDIAHHAEQYPANPIAIALTTQGGSVYGYASADSGWTAYTDRPDWYVTNFDEYGIQAGTYGGCGGGGCYPTGYVGLSVTAPGTVNGLTAAATAPKINVSDAKYVMLKMGNEQGGGWVGPAVVTVVLSNGTGIRTPYTDPHTDATATAVCSSDVTLATIGDGMPLGPDYPSNREHGLFTYKVDLKTFKCSKGTVSKALTSLSAVSMEIRNDKNAAGLYTDFSNTGGSLEWLSVSRISFGR